MWFITAINTQKDSIGNPTLIVNSKRTFGYFERYSRALKAIRSSEGDLHEELYDYLVLEEIFEGIHPHTVNELWFSWMDIGKTPIMKFSVGQWVECDKPEDFKGISNFALG